MTAALSPERVRGILGGLESVFAIEERGEGLLLVCVARAEIRGECVCEAARALVRANLDVDSPGDGRIAVAEKTYAAPWTAPDFDEDDTIPPVVVPSEDDEEDTDVDSQPPLFVRPFDSGRFRVTLQRAGADPSAIERALAAQRRATGGEDLAGYRGERGAA